VDSNRKIAVILGALFIVGTVAGILSVVLANPILNDPNYLTKIAEDKNQVITGTLLVLIMGFALAMIPVVAYPIFKKYNKTLALGYVVFRGGLETATYIAMATSSLVLITLSQQYVQTGASSGYFQTLGTLLLGTHDWINIILIIVYSLGALMFYCLLYQSKLIPRWLSGWGIIGITMHFATAFLVMYGFISTMSTIQVVLSLPIALQEMVLAIWLIVKGFNSSAIISGTKHKELTEKSDD
jgi:hypothetical protein